VNTRARPGTAAALKLEVERLTDEAAGLNNDVELNAAAMRDAAVAGDGATISRLAGEGVVLDKRLGGLKAGIEIARGRWQDAVATEASAEKMSLTVEAAELAGERAKLVHAILARTADLAVALQQLHAATTTRMGDTLRRTHLPEDFAPFIADIGRALIGIPRPVLRSDPAGREALRGALGVDTSAAAALYKRARVVEERLRELDKPTADSVEEVVPAGGD